MMMMRVPLLGEEGNTAPPFTTDRVKIRSRGLFRPLAKEDGRPEAVSSAGE